MGIKMDDIYKAKKNTFGNVANLSNLPQPVNYQVSCKLSVHGSSKEVKMNGRCAETYTYFRKHQPFLYLHTSSYAWYQESKIVNALRMAVATTEGCSKQYTGCAKCSTTWELGRTAHKTHGD
jgi:hypothetical protein